MSVVSNTMQFLLILVGRQCRGVDRTFQRGGGGGEGGHTLSNPAYVLACRVDIHAAFIESDNLSDEQ